MKFVMGRDFITPDMLKEIGKKADEIRSKVPKLITTFEVDTHDAMRIQSMVRSLEEFVTSVDKDLMYIRDQLVMLGWRDHDKAIYIVDDEMSDPNMIYCLDVKTGKIIDKVKITKEDTK